MAGGFVTYNLSDRVEVTPPTRKQQLELAASKADGDIFNRPKDDSDVSDSDEEEEEDSNVEYNPHQAVKYVPQTIQRGPFQGEIIGIQK
jgi:hypothetical protein